MNRVGVVVLDLALKHPIFQTLRNRFPDYRHVCLLLYLRYRYVLYYILRTLGVLVQQGLSVRRTVAAKRF